MKIINGKYTSAKLFADIIEETAIEQIEALCNSIQFKDCKVSVMPDVHAGSGCTIGTVIDCRLDNIAPQLVGVDLNCGLSIACLGTEKIDLVKLDSIIREKIPSGFNIHKDKEYDMTIDVTKLKCYTAISRDIANFSDKFYMSIGTLGGGNHYIELNVDDNGVQYLTVHSGSRGPGLMIAEYYIKLAKLYAPEYTTPVLPRDVAACYLHDVELMHEYTIVNRFKILSIITQALGLSNIKTPYNVTHNYIEKLSEDTYRIRKGAISAKAGEFVAIPLNMRDGVIFGTGKGNEEWLQSAPHGGGRLMSRKKAKRHLNLVDFKEDMNGVYTTCVDETTLDESPRAYKPMASIVDGIKDTVDITGILKPVYNFKAGGQKKYKLDLSQNRL